MASMPIYNVQVPYMGVIEHGFHPGKLVKIQGTVLPSASRFAINLLCGPNSAAGDDIALHLNPRFDSNCIVRNSLQHMNWQQEEAHGPMPLARGQGFEILLLCDPTHYKIAVNGQHFAEFSHRLPFQRVSHMCIEGDVTIAAIIYEGGSNTPSGMAHQPVPGFAPPQPHMPGGASIPHSGSGNLYPTVPPVGAPSSMPYPTQPSAYGPSHPHGQGQPMYGQGYQQQQPYPGYGQPLPGQYSPSPSGYPQGYQPPGYQPQGYQPQGYQPQGYQPPGYQPQGHQQYPTSPSQGSGFSLDKAGAALAGALGSATLMGALGGQRSPAPASNRGGIGGLFDQAGAALTGALGSSGIMGAIGGKKAMKEQHKQQKKQAKMSKKALKYGLPIAGLGVGAYALHKTHKHKGFHGHHGHHGHSSSSSSSSSEEE